MSRAFVNEDHFVEDLADRPVPEHPNLVTEQGIALIDSALEDTRRQYGRAQAAATGQPWPGRRGTFAIGPHGAQALSWCASCQAARPFSSATP